MKTQNTQLFNRFDENSILITLENCYSKKEALEVLEQISGNSIMYESNFKEAATQLAKEYGYWLNNNWFIPTSDGYWKQDINNIEYQVTIDGLNKDGFWNDDELFEMFNNKK